MGQTLPALALLLALVPSPPPRACLAAPPGEDLAKLRAQVLDGTGMDEPRLRAALALERADPEMLGNAFLEMAEKQKSAGDLNLLVAFTLQEETRHLRLMATYAAWQSAPDRAAAAFLEKIGDEDDKHVMRAVEAAGLIAPLLKDRTPYAKILEVAKGPRAFPGIEAARALNRAMDRRLEREIVDAACATPDNHVRKHLVWAVMDLEGDERPATKVFEAQRARAGPTGKNANECAEILKDKMATPFTWNPQALKDAGTWWRSGRPKDLQTAITWKDKDIQDKFNSWFDEMKKDAPVWEHMARSCIPAVGLRTAKLPEVYDLKRRTFFIEATEIIQCQSAWQGSYVLARDAGIALAATLGEPSAGHRGWEVAYVDLHSFMKTTKHGGQTLEKFVDESVAKKGWP